MTVKRPGQLAECDPRLVDRLLGFFENELIPATRASVGRGNKMFGAGMLRKQDWSTVIVGTNNETENPLWHGEVHAIKLFYELPAGERPKPEEILFVASHEPCPLCLSAIAWAGYDNYHYLFTHEDSRDSFAIGHDLKILKEVFKQDPGGYARDNFYWKGYSITDLIGNCDETAGKGFMARIEAIKRAYGELSDVYQAGKADNEIPLK